MCPLPILGVYNFLNCFNLRRPVEIERGLDRLECRVIHVQYRILELEARETQSAVQVLEKAVRVFERKPDVAPIVAQVTISGNNYI
jgi:hypothetical protein